MDKVKEAFQKIKQEINSLKQEIDFLKKSLSENNKKIEEIIKIFNKENTNFSNSFIYENTTQKENFSAFPAHNPTYKPSFNPPNTQNIQFSIGNKGVPTDRQTDRQTDKPLGKQGEKENRFVDRLEIVKSLDNLKKEIRIKFKRLTNQEFAIFSTIYQLEESVGYADYKLVSQKVHLTESSVRDYVGKLIQKGIPIEKLKISNKKINLSISSNLKQIASLSTILNLREI